MANFLLALAVICATIMLYITFTDAPPAGLLLLGIALGIIAIIIALKPKE